MVDTCEGNKLPPEGVCAFPFQIALGTGSFRRNSESCYSSLLKRSQLRQLDNPKEFWGMSSLDMGGGHGQTQGTLDRLSIQTGLGMPQHPIRRAKEDGCGSLYRLSSNRIPTSHNLKKHVYSLIKKTVLESMHSFFL